MHGKAKVRPTWLTNIQQQFYVGNAIIGYACYTKNVISVLIYLRETSLYEDPRM